MKIKTQLLIALFVISGKLLFSDSVIVFAAASTADLLSETGLVYTQETGIEIKINPASSGTLARQLEYGAYADVFMSASQKWIEYVNELDILEELSPIMTNRLALIAPSDSKLSAFLITEDCKVPVLESWLSIADPAHAPAGRYAVEALKNCGWYNDLAAQILPAADVRKALSVVEFGEADLGIVYNTDAARSNKIRIISIFPKSMHSPITYYIGLTNEASQYGTEFFHFLSNSDKARVIIEKHGFSFFGENES